MTNEELATKVMDLLDKQDPHGELEVTRHINQAIAEWGAGAIIGSSDISANTKVQRIICACETLMRLGLGDRTADQITKTMAESISREVEG